ncbi:alpha/beta hydrolase [Actinomycetospora sp. NBRC 106378]|uniref:alpha/beta hydrolase n=1 Tax=Actinomycetospora sp. NBRC 106378 TaxID=3032208 RepID=UPI0024A49CEF|nr:alpha/beta hydrolase [Actinomycetospora sp. NBRC 106378]GLZ51190.1 acetylhydrolase [Actinomycetospora sp. NBRC 106378]
MSALDPDLAAGIGRLEADGWLPITRGTPEEARQNYRDLALLRRGAVDLPVAGVHDDVVTDPTTDVDVVVRVYEPADPGGVTVVWLHGGGWVVGDLETADAAARRVCRHLGARVVSVDYRLAPEHPHPAPLQDAHTALRWAATRFGGRLVVGGDSAGAGLAAGLALLARDWGPRLDGQLLLYPGIDPTMSSPSFAANAGGPFLTADDMRWFYARYLPDPDTHVDPSVNLGEAARLGEVADLAPAVVAVAEFDPLRDEGVAHAEAMAAAGVPVRLLRGQGLVHGFFGLGSVSSAAQREGDRALDALAELLG